MTKWGRSEGMFVKKGEVLFRQGEEGPLYHIKSGLFKVVRLQEDGHVFLFNIIVPGEMIPHHSLISQKEYHGTVTALIDSEVEIISPDEWYKELHENPQKYEEVSIQLQQKLRMMQKRIDQLTTVSPMERLLLLEDWLERYLPGLTIYSILTQTEIGQLIGLRRETINRLLKKKS